MKVKLWLEKNLVYVTFAVAIAATIFLIVRWSDLVWIQRLAFLLYDALALHELEEMVFGFVEATDELLGEDKKVGFGQLCLFVVSIYLPLLPILRPNYAWLLVSYLVLGIVEVPAHISTIRKGRGEKKYYPGTVTAFTVVPGVAVWALVYILMNGLMYHWYWWIFAVAHVAFCFILAQFLSVRSMGIKYKDFWKNVRSGSGREKSENQEENA